MAALHRSFFSMILLVLVTGQSTTKVCDESHPCLHGGKCEWGKIEGEGDLVQVCNCVEANDEIGNKYVGLHCEHKVPGEQNAETLQGDGLKICNNNGDFCLHGGICMEVKRNNPATCNCTDEYTGIHCEIKKDHKVIQQLNEDSEGCNRECLNDGECQYGMKENEQNMSEEGINFGVHFRQFCSCKDGFDGPNCEVRTEEKCNAPCKHGGKCVDLWKIKDTHETSLSSDERFICDCSEANKKAIGKAFAGNYCEVQSTSICDDVRDDFNGQHFCTNYGTCIDRNGFVRCDCPKGYTGEHCEFPPGEGPTLPKEKQCTKTVCKNGGKCQFGMKDHGLLSEMVENKEMADSLGHLIPESANENYEHCICPEGYAGTHCEIETEICPREEKVCFHGSKCVKDVDAEYGYSCSCNDRKHLWNNDDVAFGDGGLHSAIIDDDDNYSLDESEDEVDLGGTYCQFKATSKCSNGLSCFNGGRCFKDRCICNDNFKGPYCEYTKNEELVSSTSISKNTNQPEKEHSSVVVAGISFAFLAISLVLTIVAYTRLLTERERRAGEIIENEVTEAMSLPKRRLRRENNPNVAYLHLPPDMRQIDISASSDTHSGSLSPEEERTVAELI